MCGISRLELVECAPEGGHGAARSRNAYSGVVSIICLIGGGKVVQLAAAITLSWTHSVERVEWAEDWRATPAGLIITEARVKGSGAGMDPPPEAQLRDGFWRWTPEVGPVPDVEMRNSGATADWRICIDGTCREAGSLVPPGADPVTLATCPAVRP